MNLALPPCPNVVVESLMKCKSVYYLYSKTRLAMAFFCPYVTPVTQAGFGGIRIQERGQVHEPRKESSVQGSSTARHRTQRPARERAEGDEHGRLVNTVGACLPAAERATGALDSPATPIQGHLNGWPRGALLWIVDRGFGYRFPDFS